MHTPAPWVPEIVHSGNLSWRVSSDANGYPNDGWIICGDMLGPDAEANARLIAAAPDLLAELKHCVWLLADLQTEQGLIQKQAIAAIAKAEGDL